jgi:hypothetical protein
MQDFAAKVANARREMDQFDLEEYKTHRVEKEAKKQVGNGNVKPYGHGRASLGARDHGRKAIPTTGGGDNSYRRRRLHRNPRRAA